MTLVVVDHRRRSKYLQQQQLVIIKTFLAVLVAQVLSNQDSKKGMLLCVAHLKSLHIVIRVALIVCRQFVVTYMYCTVTVEALP